MLQPGHPSAVFVTGGAGYIGSHVVDILMAAERKVTVYDNLSTGNPEWFKPHLSRPNFRFVEGDIKDLEKLRQAMPGHDLVWHLAANADIIGGVNDTEVDLRENVLGTRNVLEAMRLVGVRDLLFSSTGAVYGDEVDWPASEAAGPLLPISLYGAAKIAGEAFISAYCHLFNLRGWIFRFGNVVGGRMIRGAIHDFICKLKQTPDELLILGDGHQRKSYLLVEDCIEGMLYAYYHAVLTAERPCVVFNVGSGDTADVMYVAKTVLEEMGLTGARQRFTGGKRGWPGDQPTVYLNVEAMARLGWRVKHSAAEATRIAAGRQVDHLDGRNLSGSLRLAESGDKEQRE